MRKLVIIGANESVNKLILKAKELGYETHVFAWAVGDIGESTADYFYPISIDKKKEILKICKKIQPQGITSITTDFAVETVNYVARNLGLVANSSFTDRVSRNKYEMRQALKNSGLNVPKYVSVSSIEELAHEKFIFPVIVKPTDRWSSKGVSKVYNYKELNEAVSNAINLSIEKKAIIEEFIHGLEYSAECISYKGKHRVLTLTEKYTTGSPNFIEIGHVQPVELKESIIKKINEEVIKSLDALKVCNGASHVEFKMTDEGRFGIIEIGARMGGDCIGTDLVQLSTGLDYIRMVIDVAIGQKPILKPFDQNQVAIVKFISNKDDVNNFMIIKKKYGHHIICSSDLSNIENKTIKDSSTRLGYYIISVNSSNTDKINDIKKLCNLEGGKYER